MKVKSDNKQSFPSCPDLSINTVFVVVSLVTPQSVHSWLKHTKKFELNGKMMIFLLPFYENFFWSAGRGKG